jgi:predicted CXXCH cytochrome family protein
LNINLKVSVAVIALLCTATGSIQAQDNPHWNKNTCETCHAQASPVAGGASLIDGQQAEALCNSCHGDRGDALPCRHQSDITVDAAELDEVFRGSMKDGKIVCFVTARLGIRLITVPGVTRATASKNSILTPE